MISQHLGRACIRPKIKAIGKLTAKHRKGSTGDVLLNFRGEYTRFQDPQEAAAAAAIAERGEGGIVSSRMNGGGDPLPPPPPGVDGPLPF